MADIPMRRVQTVGELQAPGDYLIEPLNEWGKGRISYVCPNGKQCGVGLAPEQRQGPPHRWAFNGNLDRPSLTPSINCAGCWHGHITDGVMK